MLKSAKWNNFVLSAILFVVVTFLLIQVNGFVKFNINQGAQNTCRPWRLDHCQDLKTIHSKNINNNAHKSKSIFEIKATSESTASSDTESGTDTTPNSSISSASPSAASKKLLKNLRKLQHDGSMKKAVDLLKQNEEKMIKENDPTLLDEECYASVLHGLQLPKGNSKINSNDKDNINSPARAALLSQDILNRMKNLCNDFPLCTPTLKTYLPVIYTWSRSGDENSGSKCFDLINELWGKYNETNDSNYIPSKPCYLATFGALSRGPATVEKVQMAESVLEQMEAKFSEHLELIPTAMCFNFVLILWNKSRAEGSREKCESILNRMLEKFKKGRVEYKPNTISYNVVLDSLAKSPYPGSEDRAEELVQQMNKISQREGEGSDDLYSCKPDHLTFNTLLNCWAQSRRPDAARRANDILLHMERRYAANHTYIHPDSAAYSTVINAWARSRDKEAIGSAEYLITKLEQARDESGIDIHPTTVAYNSLINCYAKSRRGNAAELALQTLQKMKSSSSQFGNQACQPDVFTYTSVIDTLAKQGTFNSSALAESLLTELEIYYVETKDPRLKPNIHTYTSVVNAIARSRVEPSRAESLLDRMKQTKFDGDKPVEPDVVFYNALLNAYGWSNSTDKAKKCYQIYTVMKQQFESKTNIRAKPDMITCNAVLNACAFQTANSDEERAEVMNILVKTFEDFQQAAPTYGWPNGLTFSHVLLAIAKHMPFDERRTDMAVSTFWQCCKGGHLSPVVVANLALAIPWERFESLMGDALQSRQGEKLIFDLDELPDEWRRHATRPGKRVFTRPSTRSGGNNRFRVKKSFSKSK